MYHKKSHNNYIYEGLAREPYRTLPSLSSMASSSSKRAVVVLDLVWLCLALRHIILVKGREVPSHEPGRKNHVLNKGIDVVQRPSKREMVSEKESYMSFGEQDPANFQPKDDTLQRTAHFAVIKSKGGTYFGTRAKINIWQPQVKNGQSSTAAIWVSNGLDSPENYNKIVVGWHVAPELYGDTKTHFFTHWQGATGTVFNGCYNVECPGFVLTSPDPLIPGAILDKTSTVDGKQYYLPLQIAQEIFNPKHTMVVEEEILPRKILTPEAVAWLQRRVTTEEVEQVFLETNPDKAPGPDGFPTASYQQNWDIVKHEVIKAIQNSFYQQRLLSEVITAVISAIWYERNFRIFESGSNSKESLLKGIYATIKVISPSQNVWELPGNNRKHILLNWGLPPRFKEPEQKCCHWHKPPQYWFSLNTDASRSRLNAGERGLLMNASSHVWREENQCADWFAKYGCTDGAANWAFPNFPDELNLLIYRDKLRFEYVRVET